MAFNILDELIDNSNSIRTINNSSGKCHPDNNSKGYCGFGGVIEK